jgi:excisionase family DNA binding protein
MVTEAGPALYTVEEAARLLRVGRTKAYAMTQEWRVTGGASGLPVVDFGNVLRVPRAALERLLGVDLSHAAVPWADPASTESTAAAAPTADPAGADPEPRRPTGRPRRRTLHPQPTDQLDLFDAAS